MSLPLIELSSVSLVLDGHPVLDKVSFSLRRGERWALVGPNGSGKTMLLRMLRGDVWPTPGAGRRRYCFDSEASEHPRDLKHHIAYVGPERQDKYVRYGWNLRVDEVVTTGLFDQDIPLTRPTRRQRERVTRTLHRFGLASLRRRRMLTLSHGQRRRVLVARAFVGEAQVLLLDEVFNGLDARTKAQLRRALEKPRSGDAWVLTSHRPQELPRNVTNLARMEEGRLLPGSAPSLTLPRKRGRGKISGSLLDPLTRLRGRVRERAGAAQAPPLITLRNATLYRDYRPVIRDLNWTIRRGEHWAVLGANGSGKSTLLSLLHGDLHPALGGSIERAGHDPGSRIEDWKQRVGWLSPELQADHYLARSIEDIVISGRYASIGLNDAPTRADRGHARRWLKFFGIDPLRKRGPRQVSYGQMRLALIARAMVNEPELLLLDEPCAGLDTDVRAQVLAFMEQLARSGVQIVMAVHDRDDIMPSIGNVLQIGRGGCVRLSVRSALPPRTR